MPWKLVIIKFITEEIKMNVPMDISKTATPVLGDIISSCVSIIKSNNDTKIALAQIDSDLHKELKKLDNQFIKQMKIIEKVSSMIDQELSKTDISNEVKLLFIDKFINALLDVANSN